MTCNKGKKQQHPANMQSRGLQPTSWQSFLYTTVKLNLFSVISCLFSVLFSVFLGSRLFSVLL